MLLSKKRNDYNINQRKQECLLLICKIEKEIDEKELLLEKEKLKKITKFQLDEIKNDISSINEVLNSNSRFPNDFFLQSFANLFKSSDWEYNGEEEKELFTMLSKLNNIIEDIKHISM